MPASRRRGGTSCVVMAGLQLLMLFLNPYLIKLFYTFITIDEGKIFVTLMPSAVRAVGVLRSVVSFKPSWPKLLRPQHETDPSVRSAHE